MAALFTLRRVQVKPFCIYYTRYVMWYQPCWFDLNRWNVRTIVCMIYWFATIACVTGVSFVTRPGI
jgi:hypothetical protein